MCEAGIEANGYANKQINSDKLGAMRKKREGLRKIEAGDMLICNGDFYLVEKAPCKSAARRRHGAAGSSSHSGCPPLGLLRKIWNVDEEGLRKMEPGLFAMPIAFGARE
jgi:hypothetical protein